MGMGGMTTDAYAKYASANDEKKTTFALTHKSSMTVAELRNFVNPMTKYYDQLPAKNFIEDEAIPDYDKICAIFGETVAKCIGTNCIESKFKILRKAVS